MNLKVIKEIYEVTGKNVIFEIDDPKNSDPLVWQALIWQYRKATNPEARFEEVTELSIKEMVEAYQYFFRQGK